MADDRLKAARALGYYENAHMKRDLGVMPSHLRYQMDAIDAFKEGWREAEADKRAQSAGPSPEFATLNRLFMELKDIAEGIGRLESAIEDLAEEGESDGAGGAGGGGGGATTDQWSNNVRARMGDALVQIKLSSGVDLDIAAAAVYLPARNDAETDAEYRHRLLKVYNKT